MLSLSDLVTMELPQSRSSQSCPLHTSFLTVLYRKVSLPCFEALWLNGSQQRCVRNYETKCNSGAHESSSRDTCIYLVYRVFAHIYFFVDFLLLTSDNPYEIGFCQLKNEYLCCLKSLSNMYCLKSWKEGQSILIFLSLLCVLSEHLKIMKLNGETTMHCSPLLASFVSTQWIENRKGHPFWSST